MEGQQTRVLDETLELSLGEGNGKNGIPKPEELPLPANLRKFQSKVERVRVTFLLPKVMDRNLEALSISTGQMKTEIVRRALDEFLRSKGLDPERHPKVTVSY